MTEKEFWIFLNDALAKGRTPQVSKVMDSDDPQLKAAGKFIGGHSLLPKDYDKIAIDKIIEIGKLLLNKNAGIPTKEAVLMLLAHHPSKEALSALKTYNENPKEELRIFAQLALEECEMWNE
ncbi:MAG: hypothetical protein U9Q24_01385 [Candidatus Ratteibacteria bacterium]|nr:hypothetical protein [Candidatus Ratteibacteria bacterium]